MDQSRDESRPLRAGLHGEHVTPASALLEALRRAVPIGLREAHRRYEQPTEAQLEESILDALDIQAGENRYALE